jgi:hypothetical protein
MFYGVGGGDGGGGGRGRGEHEEETPVEAWSVELKLTNPLDEDVMVSLFRVSGVQGGDAVNGTEAKSSSSSTDGSGGEPIRPATQLHSLEGDECAVEDTLSEAPFLLRQHDELAEQDWNDSSAMAVAGDPACVVERFQNKVVFTVPVARRPYSSSGSRSNMTAQSQRIAWFRLGVRAWSASAEELVAALGEGAAPISAGSVGLNIEYETRVEMSLRLRN